MSESNQNPAPEEPKGNLASLMMGVLEGAFEGESPAEAPAQEEAPAEEAEAPETPTEQPEAPSEEPETPAWKSQQEAGRAFAEKNRALKEAEEAARKLAEEAAYWRGLAEGRTPAKPAAEEPKAKPDEDPEPDPTKFADDADYFAAVRAWDRRQAVKEALAALEPKVANIEEQTARQAEEAAERAWGESMARAQAKAGDQWARVTAFANQMRRESRGWGRDLDSHPDPGAFALKAYLTATGQAVPAAVSKAATPSPASGVDPESLVNDPAHQEAVLRAIAAKKAAAGEVPRVPTGPRGVGSGPGAQGASDALSRQTIRQTTNPEKLSEYQRAAFTGWLADGEFEKD